MISRKTLLLLFVSSLFYAFLTAQNHHHQPGLCVEQHLHEQKMKNDPIYKAAQDRLEASTYRSMLRKQQAHQLAKNNTNCNSGTGDNSNESIPIIPVVVHVLHSSDYPEPGSVRNNPNDEQIRRAIQHLNDAFRNRGAYSDDGRAAKDPRNPDRALMKSQDIRVEFRLAERNRLNRAVTGIMRYETDEYARLDINRDDQMKRWVAEQNNNAFPTTQYANVYLVSSICDGDPNTSRDCGVAGYAYLAGSHGRFFDGIVNEMQYFGSTTTNSKVHIHEFGHYFNLRHTFQGGCGGSDCLRSGDLVCDTPGDDENRGLSCGNAQNSCTEDVNAGFFSVDQGDMYENYMDYFTIRCQNTFTQGQKDRMRSALFGARSSLLSSKGAIPVGSTLAAINTIAAPKGIACDPSISPRVEIENKGDRSITSMKIQYELGDGSPRFYDWNGNIAARSKQTITLPNLSLNNIGRYDLFVQILAVNGADADVSVDGFCQSFQFAPALTELPYCQSVIEDVIPIEWAVENPDEGVGFQTTRIDGCETRERYAFVLETWGQFPDQTTQDEIYTQAIDLSQYDAAYLDFDVAYATTFPNFNTILDLSVSTDCGASYTSVYNKTGDQLATTRVQAQNSTDMNAAFEPVACNEWRKESVNLSAYAGQKINIRIQASTANLTNSNVYEWGNNLYLDNFCLNFERCSAPIPTTESEISICGNLEVDASVENLSEDKDVFWWITSSNPITTIITNQQVLESAVGFTPLGDASGLSGQGNIIFRANAGEGRLNIPVDCSKLRTGAYYATPLILNTDLSNPFFDDCTFGRPVAFSCDCSSGNCALAIASTVVEDASNCGVSNGAITVSVNDNEDVEYSINGQNWQRNNRFAGLAAGTYTLFVRSAADVSCATSLSNIVINEPARPVINDLVVVSPTCEAANGSLRILAEGDATLSYRLNNGAWQNENVFNNLAVGNYEVQVRNRNATTCISTRNIDLIANTSDLSIQNIQVNAPRWCGEQNGQFEVFIDDADDLDLEYSLDGETWQTAATFTNLAAGNYEVQIRLQNASCGVARQNVSIPRGNNDSVREIEVQNPSTCEATDGSIRIQIEASDARILEYRIDNGDWRNTPTFSGLPAGTYTLQIRNANQFSCLTTKTVVLNAPPAADISINEVVANNPSACGLADGSLTILTAAINAEYSIDGGANWQNTNTFEGLSSGTYFPQIRVGTCSLFEGEAIELQAAATDISVAINLVESRICLNEENEFFLDIEGGTAPYTIQYQLNETTFTIADYESEEILIFTPNAFVSTIAVGRITDALGCQLESNETFSFFASRCLGNLRLPDLAASLQVYPNQPNPFQNSTMIHFDLPQSDRVLLKVFSATGKLLYQGEQNLAAGYHQWMLSSQTLGQIGVLYYSLETSEQRVVEKMVRVE